MKGHVLEAEHVRSAAYLAGAVDPREIPFTIRALKEAITNSGVRFSHIAFSGLSGSLIGPILAYELGKWPVAIRKPHDQNHSYTDVEGGRERRYRPQTEDDDRWVYSGVVKTHACKYIIVDDLVASGATARRILNGVFNSLGHDAKCVGIFTYEEAGSTSLSWQPMDRDGYPVYNEVRIPRYGQAADLRRGYTR